jgi:chromate transporter
MTDLSHGFEERPPASTVSPDRSAPKAGRRARPRLRQLAAIFAGVSGLTFGGGNPTTAALQQELGTRRGWLSEADFILCYVVARLTPGTNLLAFCTAVGWILRGWPGALVALLAASIPCSLAVVLFSYLYESLSRNQLVSAAIHGALAAAVGMLVATSWQLIRSQLTVKRWFRTTILLAGSLVLFVRFRMSPIPVMGIGALAGLLWREGDPS